MFPCQLTLHWMKHMIQDKEKVGKLQDAILMNYYNTLPGLYTLFDETNNTTKNKSGH